MSLMKTLLFFKRYRIIFRILVALSIAGFLFQVYKVSDQYFRYETVTNVKEKERTEFTPSSTIFCVRYADLIDNYRVFKETGIRLERVKNKRDAYRMEGLLTVDQIFKYTPDPQDSIKSCLFRQEDNDLKFMNRSQCYEIFNVTKYFTQEFICYLFYPLQRSLLDSYSIFTASISPFLVYRLVLSQDFKNAEYGTIIMDREKYPYSSRHHTTTLKIRNLTSGEISSNMFNMRTMRIKSISLPAPYDTKCDNVYYTTPITCQIKCVTKGFRRIDRVPSEEFSMLPIDLRPVSQRDLENKTTGDYVLGVREECDRKCKSNPCTFYHAFTYTSKSKDTNEVLVIEKLSPGEPDFIWSTHPSMMLIEYFSFVAGCICAWFGLSFMKVNPFPTKDPTKYRKRRGFNQNLMKRVSLKPHTHTERMMYLHEMR